MLSAYRGAAVLAVSTAVLHMTQVRRTPIVRLDQHRTAGDDEYADYASPHVLSDMTDFVQSDGEVDYALPVHGRGHGGAARLVACELGCSAVRGCTASRS